VAVMGYKTICQWFEVCPLKRLYEQGKLNKSWIDNYCRGDYKKCVRRKMEDEGMFHSDNMLPDGTIDRSLK
jgi:hypothetical protein